MSTSNHILIAAEKENYIDYFVVLNVHQMAQTTSRYNYLFLRKSRGKKKQY